MLEFTAKYNLGLQPYVIVVGATLDKIEAPYVNINKTLYSIESPFKAIDICYKVFHVLNAKYPPESEQIWLLLQQCLYKFEISEDKKIKGAIRLRPKFSTAF